jgi:hypothetical protein
MLKATKLTRLARDLANDATVSAEGRADATALAEMIDNTRRQLVFLGEESRKGLLRWFDPATAMFETMTFDVRFLYLSELLQAEARVLSQIKPTTTVAAYQQLEKVGDVEAERRVKAAEAGTSLNLGVGDTFDTIWTVAKWGGIGLGVYFGSKFLWSQYKDWRS